MNLGFADQFVPFVEDGSKTHSIRAGERWKVGMRADLYRESRRPKVFENGVQTAGMRLIFRAPVVRVEHIAIREVLIGRILKDGSMTEAKPRLVIEIEGARLSDDEADLFAWRDGFRHRTLAKPADLVSIVSPATIGCFGLMMDFWKRTHDIESRDFHGQIIHWDYTARRMEKEIWPKGRQHPCEYVDPATHYDPPFGGAR